MMVSNNKLLDISLFNTPLEAYNYYFNIYIKASHRELITIDNRNDDKTCGGMEWKDIYNTFIMLQDKLNQEGYASFISNDYDDIDETHTCCIPTLAIKYIIGDCIEHYIDGDINIRSINNLSKVNNYYKEYISIIKRLKIINDNDKYLLNTGDDRDAKIDRRRKEKQLKEKYLNKDYYINRNDEEGLRDSYVSLLLYFTLLAVDQVRIINFEIECLKERDKVSKVDNNIKDNNSKDNEVDKKQHEPWVIRFDNNNNNNNQMMNRMNIKEQVFRPDISMPTMTLDEWAKIEMQQQDRRMIKSNNNIPNEGYIGDNSDEGEEEEDYEDEGAETKARNWDDWKDDHPKGLGNKMTNIG